MKPFTGKVISIIKDIPEGYVMTYGQIAKLAGHARAARQVVRILHSMSSSYELPWHRIVNAKGEIALQDDELRLKQMEYLQAEGVVFSEKGLIDLEKYRYHPNSIDGEFWNEINGF